MKESHDAIRSEGLAPRLLVVGGTGFIGRHVSARGSDMGWRVTQLSLRRRISVADSRADHLVADIAVSSSVMEALRGRAFEYVVNCGGYIDHTPFSRGGRSVIDAHFGGVMNLVTALDRGPLRSFVNIGSSDEYGLVAAPQREDQVAAPRSPYGIAKLAAAELLQMLARSEAFPAITLRLFLTYGPGQGTERFLPQVIAGCLRDAHFPASAGEQLRDFCYIEDTVDAIFVALQSPNARGEIFNIGSGRPTSIRAMIDKVRAIIGTGAPRFGTIPYRPGENMSLYADISKARELLGWEPRVSSDAGLRSTIDWIREVLSQATEAPSS